MSVPGWIGSLISISLEKPLIIFDGGTGTSFQNLNLTSDDFGGKELEGCNENLVCSPMLVNLFDISI